MEKESGVPRRYLMGVSSIDPKECDDAHHDATESTERD